VPVIAVTNQSGVAKGYFAEELVQQVNAKIAAELTAQSAHLDAIYYCPHHPQGTVPAYRKECRCRKPATGMLEEASRQFSIDLRSSYVVGDSYRDMQMGFNAGARTILVLTGYGRGEFAQQRDQWQRTPDRVVADLLEAVEYILEDLKSSAAQPAAGLPTPHHNP
jgi:D-glycero-D-manno-heptose 1,7-bisphosphate phosphatase